MNSEKQLKDRMKSWGLGKNITKPEMRAIVRKSKQRQAQGKSSVFTVRDEIVPESKIARWQSRQENEGPINDPNFDRKSPKQKCRLSKLTFRQHQRVLSQP